MRRELEVDLEPETQALIDQIREGVLTRSIPETEEQAAGSQSGAERRPALSAALEPARDRETSPMDDRAVFSGRPWAFPRLLSRRRAAMALWTVAVALTVSVAATMLNPEPPARDDLAGSLPEIAANSSWRPPQPSRSGADASVGRERGLVAVAVLPFAGYGDASDTSALVADIVTDDLTNMLSRVNGFRIISRQTSRAYKGRRIDAAVIGAELGVPYLLEGTVTLWAQQLRVSVELIDARTRLHVWSGRFDRSGADRSAILDEIVRSLGRELQVEVMQIESGRASTDANAHELTVKGWAAIRTPHKGEEGLRQAESYFHKALARDPDNVRAQNGLGAFHAHMAAQLFAADPVPHLATAEAILQRLIEQHPSLNGPHATMGLVHKARGHKRKAIQSLERSIALNPSHAPSYAQLGMMLAGIGHPEQGLEHILYAMRLSPRDPVLPFWLAFAGSAKLERGRHREAIEYYERALALNPGQPRTTLALVAAHALAGNLNEARRRLDELQKVRPHLTREKLTKQYVVNAGSPQRQVNEGMRRALATP